MAIEADSHHLLESLAACASKQSKLIMYFTINLAFSNYLELMPNMTEHKTLNRDKMLREQPLPVYINISCYDTTLTDRTTKLKEFIHNYICNNNVKEIFDLQRRHTRCTFPPNKYFFLNKIVNIFTFTFSIILIIMITLVMYLFCKHIRTIVASPLLCKAKEVEASTTTKIDDSGCGTLAYIGIALTLLSMAIVILLHYRKSKFCRGHKFSAIVKIVLFISDVQYFIPIKLCKTSGSLHLFKITGTLTSEDIKLNRNYLWDTLEIYWDKIKLAFNSNEIKLPKLVTIKIQDKIRV